MEPTPTSIAATFGMRSMARLPEWELGVQLSTTRSPTSSISTFSIRRSSFPEELVPIRTVGRLVLDRGVDNFFAEPSRSPSAPKRSAVHRLSNDPLPRTQLLVLDTQIKRLGGPNFPHPDQCPECPMAHFPGRPHGDAQSQGARELRAQQLGPTEGGPREDPVRGFTSFPDVADGPQQRVRSEALPTITARRAVSREPDAHRTEAHRGRLGVRISKVERPDIRSRTVSHLRNIDANLAKTVLPPGLAWLFPMPPRLRKPIPTSPLPTPSASSRTAPTASRAAAGNPADATGADAAIFNALLAAVQRRELSPKYRAKDRRGDIVLRHQRSGEAQIDGGTSDSIPTPWPLWFLKVVARCLRCDAAEKDFATDAFAHCKFIGMSREAVPISKRAVSR